MFNEEITAKTDEIRGLLRHCDKENEYKTKRVVIITRDSTQILDNDKFKEIYDVVSIENMDRRGLLNCLKELQLHNKILSEENKGLREENIRLDRLAHPEGWLNRDMELIEKEGLAKYLYRFCLYRLHLFTEKSDSNGLVELVDKTTELYKLMRQSE